jgi:hypothetical protein
MKKVEKKSSCRYYSYVLYGEAMTDGRIDKLEPVYKGFKIRKSNENFYAAFDNYGGTRSGKFQLINIGPFDNEAVIYQEINRIREDLENSGFKRAVKFKHLVTGAFLNNDKPC